MRSTDRQNWRYYATEALSPLVTPNLRRLEARESYDLLKKKVEEAADDIAKASGGNKAASTRVRKAMQDIKAQAQEIRIKVLEISRQPPAAG